MTNQDLIVVDNSIDLLLTDPPYNISMGGANPVWVDKETGENKNTIHNQKFSEAFDEDWDAVGHDVFVEQMRSWTKFWFKKVRPGGAFAVFISDQYVSYLWKVMEEAGFEPKRVWTWKKPAAVPFNRKVNPVSACEFILFGIKPGGKRTFNANAKEGSTVERYAAADKVSSIMYKAIKDSNGLNDLDAIFEKAKKEAKGMLQSRRKENGLVQCVIPNTITFSGGTAGKEKIHPTQKPVELLEYFIELLSNENDLVLDTFAGSGSTGIACLNLNRRSILIEKDKKMFAKMQSRIDKKINPPKKGPLLNNNLFSFEDDKQ